MTKFKFTLGRSALALALAVTIAVPVAYSLRAGSMRRVATVEFGQNYGQVMQYLRQHQLDIAGVNFHKRQIDVVVNSSEAEGLRNAGVRFTIDPTEGVEAPDAQYKDPKEIEAILADYAQRFPNLTQVMTFGKSLEGRPMYVIKITSNAKQQQVRKPAVLFNSMHHAREVMTPEVSLDIIDVLLTNYGKSQKVTQWVNNNEIWVVPMVNVDGNNKVWTGDSMWRKNTRGGYGVDINRNYPYKWSACNGSSSSTFAQDYHGPSAGSEPETQALMNLVSKIRPVFDISFHSYSELVLYPYGCRGEKTLTQEIVEGIGKQMAAVLPSDEGSGTYTPGNPWEILYAVDGDDIGWMYHEMQVIPYVIEVNSSREGFQPNYAQWRDKTVAKMRPGWEILLNRLSGSGIRGRVLDDQAKQVVGAVIQIQRQGTPAFNQEYRVNPDGTYHVVLNPGKYKLSFQAPGYTTQSFDLDLKNVRVDGNVTLKKGI